MSKETMPWKQNAYYFLVCLVVFLKHRNLTTERNLRFSALYMKRNIIWTIHLYDFEATLWVPRWWLLYQPLWRRRSTELGPNHPANSGLQLLNVQQVSGWWFQPIWKNDISQIESIPLGVKIKKINHKQSYFTPVPQYIFGHL